jgi:hypothetical protein
MHQDAMMVVLAQALAHAFGYFSLSSRTEP